MEEKGFFLFCFVFWLGAPALYVYISELKWVNQFNQGVQSIIEQLSLGILHHLCQFISEINMLIIIPFQQESPIFG